MGGEILPCQCHIPGLRIADAALVKNVLSIIIA